MGASEMLATQTRRRFVLEKRKAGCTYVQIAALTVEKFGADAMPGGWDERYAYKDVKRELDKLRAMNQGNTDHIRQLELERLDVMLVSVWKEIQDGNLGAIDRAVKISARRAALLGLDAPIRQNLTGLDKIVVIGGVDLDEM